MGILIPRQLTIEQYIKLFSNPISGIACEVDAYNRDHRVKYHCKNIRYSKSMILRALGFWYKQYYDIGKKMERLTNSNPMFDKYIRDFNDDAWNLLEVLANVKEKMPDTFLFSHRHIEAHNVNKYTNGLAQQNALLNKKYNMKFIHQEGTMQQFSRIKTNTGIEFTVFPNEHPYITKQKISRVGMTEKGNIYVLHKNGAQKK